MHNPALPVPWLSPGDPFPAIEQALGPHSFAPGLLAVGGDLTVRSLVNAYSQGIFPWFSDGQPILWWSPEPRMVLKVPEFRLHRSLRKTLKHCREADGFEVRVDHDFAQVIAQCANQVRNGQNGTWIVPDMVSAYIELHEAGFAHSVETWWDGQLIGGLYCVALGASVFGESMFSLATDTSKIALAGLVCLCREFGVKAIDCQQNTSHLASLGAKELSREEFAQGVLSVQHLAGPTWKFDPLYWHHLRTDPVTRP